MIKACDIKIKINKVFCDGCPCLTETNYGDYCNLGYETHSIKRPDGTGFTVSVNCRLNHIKHGNKIFKPIIENGDKHKFLKKYGYCIRCQGGKFPCLCKQQIEI